MEIDFFIEGVAGMISSISDWYIKDEFYDLVLTSCCKKMVPWSDIKKVGITIDQEIKKCNTAIQRKKYYVPYAGECQACGKPYIKRSNLRDIHFITNSLGDKIAYELRSDTCQINDGNGYSLLFSG